MKSKKEIKEIINSHINQGDAGKRRFGSHQIIDGKVRMQNYFSVFSNLVKDGRLLLDFDIAYQFRVITGNLTTLEGFPPSVDASRSKKELFEENIALKFYLNCPLLTSLEGIPSKIHGNLFCENLTAVSYKQVHKHIRFVNGAVRINNQYEGPLLGFLLINENSAFEANYKITVPFNSQQIVTDKSKNLLEALKIVNWHLKKDKDVVDCQQHLIDAGLKQFANL